MKRDTRLRSPASLLFVLLAVMSAFAQPQSPNFTMRAHTLSAGGMFDSSANFTLFSSVAPWSVADTNASANYRVTSGFLTPNYGAATGAFLVANPPVVNFGEVHIDSVSTLTITLSDTGYWSLIVSDLSLSQALLFQFTAVPTLPDTIPALGSRDYLIEFHPATAGVARDTLTITHNAGSPVIVPFEGTGTAPQIVVEPDTLAFGDIWINVFVPDTFVILNPGTANLYVDSIGSDNPFFESLANPFMVLPGENIAIPYPVSVPDTLEYSGLLTVHSDAGNPTVFVSARGVWTELEADVDLIDLGFVADTTDTSVILSSVGNVSVQIDSIYLVTAEHFALPDPMPESIAAYGSFSLAVRFNLPDIEGIFSDTLVVTHNVGNPLRIPLSAGVGSADPNANLIPTDFFLDQNYPNPFNPSTQIRFGLPKTANVTVDIYDILGRKTATLISGSLPPGYYTRIWNCSACPSGMYLIRMQSDDRVFIRKMLLMK